MAAVVVLVRALFTGCVEVCSESLVSVSAAVVSLSEWWLSACAHSASLSVVGSLSESAVSGSADDVVGLLSVSLSKVLSSLSSELS